MKRLIPLIGLIVLCSSVVIATNSVAAEKIRLSYISDSPGSSAPYWIAKEAGFYKKYGLDVELIFINGSTRGIQSLIAGDLDFTGAVGTSAINGRLAGGDIFIIDSLVNTLPYYILGSPKIKSPEDLKGRIRALQDVSRGGSALDPKVVEGLMARRTAEAGSPLRGLTDKERQVLEQMATGRTNATIAADALHERAVRREAHQRGLPEARSARRGRDEPPRLGRARLRRGHPLIRAR